MPSWAGFLIPYRDHEVLERYAGKEALDFWVQVFKNERAMEKASEKSKYLLSLVYEVNNFIVQRNRF